MSAICRARLTASRLPKRFTRASPATRKLPHTRESPNCKNPPPGKARVERTLLSADFDFALAFDLPARNHPARNPPWKINCHPERSSHPMIPKDRGEGVG